MRILHDLADLARRSPRVSLAAGTFDGVHRGHARVLRAAVARARALGGEAWALTLVPHPLSVLRPNNVPALLTPGRLREDALATLGLDGVVELPFTPELASLSPEEFVRCHLLHGDWAPEVVFAGADWRFGAGGVGRLADLPVLSGGRLRVREISALLDGGEPVSSTRIRAALAVGDVTSAARLLGRPFRIVGSVEHGRGVGRALGAATANLAPHPGMALPAPGVYAAFATASMDSENPKTRKPNNLDNKRPGNGCFIAVVNIGFRPTFHDAASGRQTIEAHLLDFQGDLYGRELALDFVARLRDERLFDTPEALAAQIKRDAETTMSIVKTPPALDGLSAEALRVALAHATQCRDASAGPCARVLQEGRNRTLLIPGEAPGGGDLVVKRFGASSRLRRTLGRLFPLAGKAVRSHRAAAYLTERGIATPEPLGLLPEGDPVAPGGALATRAVATLRSFRRELCDLYAAHGPCATLMERLRAVAEFCAEMHDAGFFHRDLGNQNLFFAGDPAEGRVMTLDLNRGRCLGRPLTLRERARDLSRIDLPSDLLRVFLEMYWRGDIPPRPFLRAERRFRRAYALHCATRHWRHPLRPRRTTPNPEGEYPAPRDIWIWDDRSAQAIPAFRRHDRHRLQQRGRVWHSLAAVATALRCGGRGRAERLRGEAFAHPVEDVGSRLTIALSATPSTLEREIVLLRELGASHVLLRLHAHEASEEQSFTLAAAQRLHAEGFGVALALVQCRESVTNPASWDALGRRALAAVGGFVRWVEVGHAVNRVKWGLWGYGDVRMLLAPVAGWRRDFPNVRFIGPAVIDFEPDFTAAVLRREMGTVGFAALSQALYVDRRGAPERMQGGLDATGKLATLRAIGECFGVPGPVIVSEFNWPLVGQGVWSPVGSPYVSPGVRHGDPSVGEEAAAAYALRYLLLGLCSGHASEMVFWRLVARGFGAVDDSDPAAWRRRPAFEALRLWHTRLNGARFERREDAPDGRIALLFSRDGGHFRVCWDPSGDALPVFSDIF